jgi:PAS domain S-box-containing protein
MGLALRNGRGNDERWHLRKDGSRFWANGEMMPLTDDDGRPVGFIKILRDRTEQRRNQERLEASERRFQMALGAAGFVGSWEWDIAADLVRTDPHLARVYSIDAGEAAAGLSIARFVASIHPDDRDRIGRRIRQSLEDESEFAEEYRLLDRDGRARWVFARGRCFYDGAGNPTSFPGVAVEITQRKAIEDALRQSETRTRLALDAAGLGAWEITATLQEMQWDARTRELFGFGPDEPIEYATSFLTRVHPDDLDAVQAAVFAAVADDVAEPLDIEYRAAGWDGAYRWLHAQGRLIRAAGVPQRFVGTVRDISAHKSAEEHRALLSFELQHRIKNTLSVVQAIVSQSLRNVASPAEARQAIGDRLVTLARAHDLLTQTSWSAAPFEAVIAGASAVIGTASERIHFAGPPLLLKARSALAFSMALHELCTNAAKYGALSNDSGHVDVRWTVSDEDVVDVVWQEVGGPAVAEPTRKGFGSRLIESSLASDLGGRGAIEYLPSGVRWTLSAKRLEIEER